MLIRRAAALSALAGLAVAMPAMGQSIPWLNPVNGNWNEAAKWTGGNIPDAPGEIARLNVAGTYTVTQNISGLTLSVINVTTPTATLNLIGLPMTLVGAAGLTNSGTVVNSGGVSGITGVINNNASGNININVATGLQVSGSMVNNGLLTVNPQGNNSFGTSLIAVDPYVVTGTGSILLNANSAAAQITGSIENGSTHTIRGFGQIPAILDNKGIVSANVSGQTLALNSASKTNSGLMQATTSGILSISTTINQTGAGMIDANTGGSVQLFSSTINGGLLDSDAAAVANTGGISALNGVTNLGNLHVNVSTGITIGGSMFTNEGVTTINPQGNPSFGTTLQAFTDMLIDGSGVVVLNAPSAAAQITNTDGTTLTNGALHTIRGFGQITAGMTNNGLVSADVPGTTLTLNLKAKTNNALMEAANGGTLAITSIPIHQSGGGTLLADAGTITLSSATINGGELVTANGGLFASVAGTQTLNNADLNGEYNINVATGTTLSPGTFTNNGTLTVNPQGNNSFPTTLAAGGTVNIDGTGTIVLNAIAAAAQITGVGGQPLTLGANQTVRGYGQITAPIVNNGLIQADVNAQRITLNTHLKTNNAVIRATGGGTIDINSTTLTQTMLGQCEADDGTFTLSSATITGGRLVSAGTGKFVSVAGIQTLNDVELDGVFDINVNTAAIIGAGSLINNGVLTVNPQANSSFATTLAADGHTLIDGVGEIVLNANASAAQITSSGGGVITFGSGQTVRGWGQIAAPFVNNGLVRADIAGQSLLFNTSPKTNQARIEAAPSSTLQINSTTVTQSPSGSILADSGTVNLSNATLTGGVLEASGTGRFIGVGGTQHLSNLMLDAPFDINVNTAATLSGAIENNGAITVNPQFNGSFFTTLSIVGPVSMTGDGELVLTVPSGASQIVDGGAGSLTMGPDNRLRGQGQISVPITNYGTISPGFSVGSLIIPAAGTVMTHEPGSVLDIELASASSFDRITGGSHTINGGTISISLIDGYTPAVFTKHTIIDGSGSAVVTGAFDGIVGPALPPPFVWKIGYTNQDVVVGVSCPSDINGDFIVDIVDFLDFLDAFGSCDGLPAPCAGSTGTNADYNGDTFVDILDFLEFFDSFGSAC
ncbi:MAG: hypothetical protein KIT19_07705 [Phycisphaeraceae bacterium]|nr:hypothetical protein [Phycisphaeraceae bacterium]